MSSVSFPREYTLRFQFGLMTVQRLITVVLLRVVHPSGKKGRRITCITPWEDPGRRAASTRNTILHSPFCDLQQDFGASIPFAFT